MEINRSVTRPALRYMGGKWRIAGWVLAHLPPHRVYIEPFGGAASVLLRKERAYAEIYNDLDGEVVNLFRVLRNGRQARRLAELVMLTPFARDEFDACYEVTDRPVERARRMVIRSFMGHGSTAVALRRRTGFRADSNRSGTTPSHDWGNLPPALLEITERMRGVVIENRPAAQILERFGRYPDALAYVDPPYLHASRSQKRMKGGLEHAYAHEMTDDEHVALLDQLVTLPCMVVLSGYESDLYRTKLRGWDKVTMMTHADGARPRREALWINPAATEACGLLAGVA